MIQPNIKLSNDPIQVPTEVLEAANTAPSPSLTVKAIADRLYIQAIRDQLETELSDAMEDFSYPEAREDHLKEVNQLAEDLAKALAQKLAPGWDLEELLLDIQEAGPGILFDEPPAKPERMPANSPWAESSADYESRVKAWESQLEAIAEVRNKVKSYVWSDEKKATFNALEGLKAMFKEPKSVRINHFENQRWELENGTKTDPYDIWHRYEELLGMPLTGFQGIDGRNLYGRSFVLPIQRERTYIPVCDYLETCEGTHTEDHPRWNDLAVWLLGHDPEDPETAYYNRLLQTFLMIWSYKPFYPETLNKRTPIFQGSQDDGKSELLRSLIPNLKWVKEFEMGWNREDQIRNVSTSWLLEIPESDKDHGTRNSSSIKAILSRMDGSVRKFREEFFVEWPLVGSFIGTTNKNRFLVDQTGSTRFVVIPFRWNYVSTGNRWKQDELIATRDQLWATAKRYCDRLYTSRGKKPDFSREDLALSESINRSRYMVVSRWEDQIQEALEGAYERSKGEPVAFNLSTLGKAMGLKADAIAKNTHALENSLEAMGYSYKARKVASGKTTRCWALDDSVKPVFVKNDGAQFLA